MPSILILEDITDTALWLQKRVESVFPSCETTLCSSVEEAKLIILKKHFDIALVDINLPDGSGISIIGQFKSIQKESSVITVTIYDDDDLVIDAIQQGADGYLLKDLSVESFEQKLDGIMRGEPALSPSIARKILHNVSKSKKLIRPTEPAIHLTNREAEVLTFLAKGLTRVEIAELLSLSPNTIAKYIKEVYRKLGVSSRAEMTMQALGLGLVTAE